MPFATLHPDTAAALPQRLAAGLGRHRQGAAGSRNNAMQTLGAPPGPTVG